ncbi:MAG: oxidoreductase [Candidatus Scalindua rubra]|uniref:Oxidoreductase n=1 Tax=Candidatus Scalindua rubra TaxID=1872076 RepID=A0A1E3XDT5_9BACT|nr:MAG: oxidoreductase [Candidatus Scalindua rubra]
MKRTNVLFVYPNRETVLRIPMAGAVLCSSVEKSGHDVRVFDTTFMGNEFKTDIHFSEKKGTVKKSGIEDYIGELDIRPLEDIVKETIHRFPPDLIAVTVLERNYTTAVNVIKELKKCTNVPLVAGGIMAITAPEVLIAVDGIDMICLGEGEDVTVDLCNAIASQKPFNNIPNLWVKENGRVIKNPMRPLIDMNEVPEQNWKPFDNRHLFRAYKGKVYRNGSFEFSRGCMKICSFCVAPELRKAQKGLGKYHRFKTPEHVIKEIIDKASQYNLNLIHFGDTDFLSGMKFNTLETFAKLYKKHIDLPFLIQTGAETINEDKMKLLGMAGCDNISIGVESGSEKIRKQVLHKYVSKAKIVDSFRIARKYKIRMTANYMFGLPDETEEDIMETIKFNRIVNPPAIAAFYFTPFLGTELYDVSLKKGYIKGFDSKANLHKEVALEMPHLPKKRVKELLEYFVEDFNNYKDEY